MKRFEHQHIETTGRVNNVVGGSMRSECSFNMGSDRISQKAKAFREGWDG